MATYVNNLRLKEIATGDESGTWGTSTNTNLELVTDGFSYGTKQMSADANETFTMPDATADATRGFYLKLTSAVSLTGTRVVTLGPDSVSKVWLIENSTTGSQIITIKQGSGGSVNVANGSKVMLVTDGLGAGAAVINANPTEVGGSVTSVGGTGTVNGISLSGTVTSSGNLTLGGTLANVNLTSQVTGTLPVANGGTGLTSLVGADIASATTVDLTAATGDTVVITGTTTTTVFTMNKGQRLVLIADAAWPMTFNATTCNINGGVSYTCAAGDRIYITKDDNNVIRVSVTKQDGTAVVAAAAGISAGLSIALAMVMGF